MSPKFNFDAPALAGLRRLQQSMAQPAMVPEAVRKKLREGLREGLNPLRAGQAEWAKQMPAINSDALKQLNAMPRMDSIFEQIARNAEFADSVSSSVTQIAKLHQAQFRSLAESARRLRSTFYPPNLLAIEERFDFTTIEQIVLEDGIALYGVPRSSIAKALVRAEGTAARFAVIDSEWRAVVDDCRALLDGCANNHVSEWVVAGYAAIEALVEGHEIAAQALVGSITDTVVTSYMGDRQTRAQFTPDRRGNRTNDAYRKLGLRSLIALGPIWQAHQQFHADDGDEIPPTFNRHATVHTVSAVQYTRRNVVQGLMLVCSLIFYIDERGTSEEAA